jgi:hypothetical protein
MSCDKFKLIFMFTLRISKQIKPYFYGMVKSKKVKKPVKTMEELTKGFDKFIEGKEINPNAKEDFDNALKNAIKKKDKK